MKTKDLSSFRINTVESRGSGIEKKGVIGKSFIRIRGPHGPKRHLHKNRGRGSDIRSVPFREFLSDGLMRSVQFTFGGKKIFQNFGAGERNSTGTSEPS